MFYKSGSSEFYPVFDFRDAKLHPEVKPTPNSSICIDIPQDESESEYYFEQLISQDPFNILQAVLYFKRNMPDQFDYGSFFIEKDIIYIILDIFLKINISEILIESLNLISNCNFFESLQLETDLLVQLSKRCCSLLRLQNEDLILPVLDLVILLSRNHCLFREEIKYLQMLELLISIDVASFDNKISYFKKEFFIIDIIFSSGISFSTSLLFGRFKLYFAYHNPYLAKDIFLFLANNKELFTFEQCKFFIPSVHEIMDFKLPQEVQILFDFLNQDDDFIQCFCNFEPQSSFMCMINDLIDSFCSNPLILISIFELMHHIPDEFLPSVTNNADNLLISMFQILLIENASKAVLCSLILTLFTKIVHTNQHHNSQFLIDLGILDDTSYFFALTKEEAMQLFTPLKFCVETKNLKVYYDSLKEIEDVITELY